MKRELILVYNADSGLVNTLKDAFHKTISPSTYQCRLCSLTYGFIGMKDEWKTFIDQLDLPYMFLHRDEFIQQLESHPHNVSNIQFPAIFLNNNGKISLLIHHNEINQCKTLDELMNLITKKLAS